MKRSRLVTLVAAILSTAAFAAEGPPSSRNDVQQFVRAYVDAQNKSDVTAVMEMISRKPSVSSAGMGKIARGWDAIRADVDKDVGSPLNPRMTLGVIDVEVLGNTHALAVASFTATLSTPQGDVQLKGALTLVVEKSAGAWKVLHEHTSVQIANPGEGTETRNGGF